MRHHMYTPTHHYSPNANGTPIPSGPAMALPVRWFCSALISTLKRLRLLTRLPILNCKGKGEDGEWVLCAEPKGLVPHGAFKCER